LRHLPDLLTGQGVNLGPPWNTRIPPLQPHGTIPPLWIGGRADIALRRAVGNGAGWLGVWVDQTRLAASLTRLRDLAEHPGGPAPERTLRGQEFGMTDARLTKTLLALILPASVAVRSGPVAGVAAAAAAAAQSCQPVEIAVGPSGGADTTLFGVFCAPRPPAL